MAYVKRAASLAQSTRTKNAEPAGGAAGTERDGRPAAVIVQEIDDLIARARKIDGKNEEVLREIDKVNEALGRLRQ